MEKINYKKTWYYTGLIAILCGLTLSVLSFLEICSTACANHHKYLLLGLPFSFVGIAFFILIFFTFLFSKRSESFRFVSSLLLVGALGAEIIFLMIQKMTGVWCPICLGIALTVLIAAACIEINYWQAVSKLIGKGDKSRALATFRKSFAALPMLLIGTSIALFGIKKLDENLIGQLSIEKQLVLGQRESDVELYVFTSWTCPACKRIEPTLERIMPAFMQNAKVVFADFGEEMTTLNFVPYNLSFMIHNKNHYLPLRQMLKEISADTDQPSENQVEEGAKNLNVIYKQLNYADVALAIEYFKELAEQYKIQAIPSVVVVNKKTGKIDTFTGLNITRANISKAINGKKDQKDSKVAEGH